MTINFDTKYAMRDISRMSAAILEMNESLKELNGLTVSITNDFKGKAGEQLLNVIKKRIVLISARIEALEKAKKSLQEAVNEYEMKNKDIINKVQGGGLR